jgi:hypothetical protein
MIVIVCDSDLLREGPGRIGPGPGRRCWSVITMFDEKNLNLQQKPLPAIRSLAAQVSISLLKISVGMV